MVQMSGQMVDGYEGKVNAHYGSSGLDARILSAFQRAGMDIDMLTRADLHGFDELHIGGVEGTRALARLAGLQAGDHVLDVGCGLGGPARTLAAEFGCTVTGLELTEAFYQAAEMLTLRVGLSSQVSFRLGSALDLPFNGDQFDAVWMQHVAMNIPDKVRLFSEINRVLKPGGRLVFHTILSGKVAPIHYPVVWAADANLDFIAPADVFQKAIYLNGFVCVVWQDVTQRETNWYQAAFARMAAGGGSSPPAVSFALFVDNVVEKAKNTLRNLEESRIAVAEGVYRKADR